MTDQRTPEWWEARLGKVTASAITNVMAKESTAKYRDYRAQLVLERLTGQQGETFTNAAMQWGIDTEPQARAAYEFERDVTVEEVGFITHPMIDEAGASPDGLVGDRGLVEIKCPKSITHLANLRGAPIETHYIQQMQWQMACTGRDWCDFVSFDPRFPPHLQLHIQRVDLDPAMVGKITEAVVKFLAEVEADVKALRLPETEAA